MMIKAPGLNAWQIGDIKITAVMELDTLVIPTRAILRTDAEEVKKHSWLIPDFADESGNIKGHIQSFVIEAGGRRILVDPCIGNDKPRKMNGPVFDRRNTPFLDYLREAGFAPETIDLVVCTHLHLDHVGWNTRLVDGRWTPTFLNARYLFVREEYEFTQVFREEDGAVFNDSVLPIVEHGLADLVETDHEIAPGVAFEPSPGHTPGHCCIRLSSRGAEAVIVGDAFQHPLQVAVPEISSTHCHDLAQSTATRRHMLARYRDTDTLILAHHFSAPIGFWVRSHGDGCKLVAPGAVHGDRA
jgi:glyoxylase-like metal-dependent hydrolase (beta-lactamase superfamily II)